MAEVLEGLQEQNGLSSIVRRFDTSNDTLTPAASSVIVRDESDEADVTSTVMSVGSPSESTNFVVLPAMDTLTVGRTYRVEVLYTDGGTQTFDAFCRVRRVY